MNIAPDKTICLHEAGHAAHEVICGHLPLSVSVDKPEAGISGCVTHDFRDYGTSPETAPDLIVGILLGPMAEGKPGWPLEWPLDPEAASKDARQCALLAEFLELDEDGWDSLVRQALAISESKAFNHLVSLLAYALERLYELDQEQIRFLIGPDVCRRYGIAPDQPERTADAA